jgi:hypothetical protein
MPEVLSVGPGLPPGIFVPLTDAPRRPLPLDGVKVSAGFPSPAADYEDARVAARVRLTSLRDAD